MFLRRNKKNNDTYYSIAESYREDGKTKQRILKNLGSRKKLDKEYGDAEAYAQGILEKMKAEAAPKVSRDRVKITLVQDKNQSFSKSTGQVILNAVYSMLEIDRFLDERTQELNLPYNLKDVLKLLVFNNFLSPGSPEELYNRKADLFGQFEFTLEDTYEAMGYLSRLSVDLQSHLNKTVRNIIDLDLSLGKYDVTDLYWDMDNIKPVIQVGIMYDSKGIPLSYNIVPDKESQKPALLDAAERTQRNTGIERIIVEASRESKMFGFVREDAGYRRMKRWTGGGEIELTQKPDSLFSDKKTHDGGKDLTDWVLNDGRYLEEALDYINAGVLVSYIDLLIHRILRVLCDNKFYAKDINRAIRGYSAVYAGDGYFTLNERYEVIDFFSELFNLEISPRHFISQAEINKILHKKFDSQEFCKK